MPLKVIANNVIQQNIMSFLLVVGSDVPVFLQCYAWLAVTDRRTDGHRVACVVHTRRRRRYLLHTRNYCSRLRDCKNVEADEERPCMANLNFKTVISEHNSEQDYRT